MKKEAYPLHWPLGYSRTDSPEESRFTTTMGKATKYLVAELERLKAVNIVISTNIPLTREGLPYANWESRKISDRGVAVYFNHEKKDFVLACDKWKKIQNNVHAIALTIAAMRGMDRWGCSDIIERSFTGFTSLPSGSPHDILGVSIDATEEEIKKAYRFKCLIVHPDRPGGSEEEFKKVNEAYNEMLEKFNN